MQIAEADGLPCPSLCAAWRDGHDHCSGVHKSLQFHKHNRHQCGSAKGPPGARKRIADGPESLQSAGDRDCIRARRAAVFQLESNRRPDCRRARRADTRPDRHRRRQHHHVCGKCVGRGRSPQCRHRCRWFGCRSLRKRRLCRRDQRSAQREARLRPDDSGAVYREQHRRRGDSRPGPVGRRQRRRQARASRRYSRGQTRRPGNPARFRTRYCERRRERPDRRQRLGRHGRQR